MYIYTQAVFLLAVFNGPWCTSGKSAEKARNGNADDGVFTVTGDSGPCLRATMEVSLAVRYWTQGLDKTRLLTKELYLPDDTQASGTCSSDSAELTLTWAQGNYSLHFTFTPNITEVMNGNKTESKIQEWTASRVQLEFATGLGTDYPQINKDGIHRAESPPDLSYMTAPYNFSYHCVSEKDILLQEYSNGTVDNSSVDGVTLGVYKVQVQAGHLPTKGKFGQEVQCPEDQRFAMTCQRMVTVAVAAVLASTILIILIGYYVLKIRSKVTYATMD